MQAESLKEKVKSAPKTLEMRFQEGNVGLGLNQRPVFQGLLHLGRGPGTKGEATLTQGCMCTPAGSRCSCPPPTPATPHSKGQPPPPGDEAKLGVGFDTFLPPVSSLPVHQPILMALRFSYGKN